MMQTAEHRSERRKKKKKNISMHVDVKLQVRPLASKLAIQASASPSLRG